MLHVIVGSTDSEAVAKTVAKKAKDINAEAIVVAKHTKGRLKEMWLGSVTKTLLKATSLPIAVVPNQQAAAP